MRNSELTPADLRERIGLTQQDVAIALGKSVSSVASWEQFRKRPRLSFTETIKLCRLYRVPIETLAIVFDRTNPDDI